MIEKQHTGRITIDLNELPPGYCEFLEFLAIEHNLTFEQLIASLLSTGMKEEACALVGGEVIVRLPDGNQMTLLSQDTTTFLSGEAIENLIRKG